MTVFWAMSCIRITITKRNITLQNFCRICITNLLRNSHIILYELCLSVCLHNWRRRNYLCNVYSYRNAIITYSNGRLYLLTAYLYCGTIMVILLFAKKKILQMWAAVFKCGPQVVKNQRLIKTSLTFGSIIYRRINVVAFNIQLSCLLRPSSAIAKNLSYAYTVLYIRQEYFVSVCDANQRTSAESSEEY